jgi:hypothetical protein
VLEPVRYQKWHRAAVSDSIVGSYPRASDSHAQNRGRHHVSRFMRRRDEARSRSRLRGTEQLTHVYIVVAGTHGHGGILPHHSDDPEHLGISALVLDCAERDPRSRPIRRARPSRSQPTRGIRRLDTVRNASGSVAAARDSRAERGLTGPAFPRGKGGAAPGSRVVGHASPPPAYERARRFPFSAVLLSF